jgi:2-dehydropantoate 2-reductase
VLAHLAAPTTIVTIQNGLGVMEALKRGLGSTAARHRLVAAVTYQAASPAADGTIRHVANLETLFDGAAGLRPAAARAAAIFKSAGLPARVVADLKPHVWRKLIANAAINPLTALQRVANGVLAERQDLQRDMLALARETALVARAEGFGISDGEAEKVALQAAQKTADNISSMRQDVEAGRATEIEFLGGAVLRLAARHGLSLPRTSDVTQALRRLESQKD